MATHSGEVGASGQVDRVDATYPHPFLKHPPATALTLRDSPPEEEMRQIDPQSLPRLISTTNLDIDVTEGCNLGCIYCFKSELYAKHMSLLTMKRAFDWLVEASGVASSVNCNFMGGEPTLRWKEIKQFCIWARRKGASLGKKVTFSMTSNLTLWNDDIRAFVDEYGFGVLMSIDGCPEVQDAQRPALNGKPMSATVEKWAKSMLRTRPRSTARSTLHPKFVHKFYDNIVYLHAIGFQEIAIANTNYSEWTEGHFRQLQAEMMKVVDYLADAHQSGRTVTLTVLNYYLDKLLRYRKVSNDDAIQFQKAPCGAGKGYLMIDYTGDIWPCHRFDGADTDAKARGQFRLGNIFTSGFNHQLQRAFLDFDHSKMHKASCERCPANPVCGGFCPAANLSSTGSIYTPHDAFCAWTQLMYVGAEALYDELAKRSPHLLASFMDRVAGSESDGR